MSPITQNIYDNNDFFKSYATLQRSQQGLAGAKEWPIVRDMVLGPQRSIKRLQTHITAVDVSKNMIQKARDFETQSPAPGTPISYGIADLETSTLDSESTQYDLVYSSLTFHYIHDLGRLFRQIRGCIRPGGRLVFSVEHPICTAPVAPGPVFQRSAETKDGAEADGAFWPLNSYCEEGPRYTSWLGTDGVRKYHRTLESYLALLRESGFALGELKEWTVSREDVVQEPEYAVERHRPYFFLVAAEAV
ncbi:hypothetical protein HFD88_002410 [Aspergillus terreus]|nr:hypothetical protein HFD88_002410 [Aspergillus terreus]